MRAAWRTSGSAHQQPQETEEPSTACWGTQRTGQQQPRGQTLPARGRVAAAHRVAGSGAGATIRHAPPRRHRHMRAAWRTSRSARQEPQEAPPAAAPDTASTASGRAIFTKIGCTHCHTPTFTTGKMIASGSSKIPSAALSNQPVRLWSDLLVHHMGKALADGITQGSAGPDEFRTAPLWGLGQRVFFMHDGRTSDIFCRSSRNIGALAARQPGWSNSSAG